MKTIYLSLYRLSSRMLFPKPWKCFGKKPKIYNKLFRTALRINWALSKKLVVSDAH